MHKAFSEGLAVVEMNGRAGFIDMKGNEVISLEYESAFRFEEGLAMVKKRMEDMVLLINMGKRLFH